MIRFLQTPGPIKKVVLGGLLTIVCVLMVITLVPGFGSGNMFGSGTPQRGVVATVDGQDVTSLEVERQARQMIQQQFPKGGAQAAMFLPFFAGQAAQQLISQKALIAEAKNMGFHVTDAELSDELQHGRYAAYFFPNGKFVGQDEYQAMLQNADLTIPQFESQVKDEILVNKLRTLVAGSAVVTDAEVQQQFEKQNSKVKFDYAFFTKDNLEKSIHPTDAELKAYYDRNKANYTNSVPEKRKIQYAVLDMQHVASQVNVTPGELDQYYDQHRDEYRTPEQINVRQILIKTPLPGPDGKVNQKGVDEAKSRADDILKQLKAGANFAQLAKKYSEDPSASEGGSLGWIQASSFPVADVAKVADSLPKGGTSDVINAGYAFVILHIDDKREAQVKPLAEVQDQIQSILKQQKASQVATDQASALVAQARTSGLAAAAGAKGLQVVTTDYVSRTDALPGIGNAPEFMSTVFGEPQKAPPDEAETPQGFVVFQVLDVRPAATPTFDEIRSRVESEFENERAAALLSQKTQELSDRAKAEHDLKKAAKELGATLKTSDLVLPDAQVPDIGVMSGPASVAFSMKPGDISGPLESGDTGAVLEVVDKQAPSEQDLAAKKDQIRDTLQQSKQEELFNVFVANLRDQMEKSGKIKINQDEYKALTRAQNSDEGE
jgi:peptidyl-prolyl cis-trans isomerase D